MIFAHPDLVFKLVMDLGYLRSQWDLTYDLGHVFERVNEYTDIIHVAFRRQVGEVFICILFYLIHSRCGFLVFGTVPPT